jgi:uncharacterized integral membrane protein (TIGR00698 family)
MAQKPLLLSPLHAAAEQPSFRLACAAAAAFFSSSPALSLVLGALLTFTAGNPDKSFASKASKWTLQLSVVLLGFGLEIATVLKVGRASIGITFTAILLTLALGAWLGKLFGVGRDISLLISGGTAICGGSAIAALAPAIGASQSDTAIALAAVFLLNALALVLFPPLGHYFGLTQHAFGLWSAMAIHDTSSVVGAAATYGAQALAIATTVKLTRALWILPVSLTCAKISRSKAKPQIPWFLFGFVAAALLRSSIPVAIPVWNGFSLLGRHMMSGALFLVGTGLTVAEIKRIGPRPLLKAVTLWFIVSCTTLIAILYFNLKLSV